MSTAADLARARHEQALADLARAEAALAAAVAAAGIQLRPIRAKVSNEPDSPVFTLPLEGFEWRTIEAAAEDHRNNALASAWSTWKRAQNATSKARRALLLAQTAPAQEPAPKPAKRPARRKVGFLSYARTLLAEELAA
jgi:hypothetical protein